MDRAVLQTPFGPMALVVDEEGAVTTLSFLHREPRKPATVSRTARTRETIASVRRQLDEYFDRRRTAFDLPLNPRGKELERRVWASLQAIPYGTTTTYGAIAAQLNIENGARAVGRANGANPIPIVIPCHRVVGSNGALVGYGAGLRIKEALLRLEGVLLQRLTEI
jgi:methylated-DNA-[protein]-cysteine S-methyltransferase